MLLSCKCLNITIKVQKSDEHQDRGLDLSKLSNVGSDQGQFFKQALGPFEDVAITKEQNALIQIIVMDDWHLNRCINCKEIAFAVNESSKRYLVNSNLKTSTKEIEKIRASSVYSNIFRVAMVQAEFVDIHGNNKPTYIDKPRIKNLHQQLHEAIQKETTAVEEKIRLFTEQQNAMLKMQRHRAEQEFHTLCSVINCVPEHIISIQSDDGAGSQDSSDVNKSLMETPPATPDNDDTPMSIGSSPIASSGDMIKQQKMTPNKGKSITFKTAMAPKHSNLSQGNNYESSLDSECIFEIDGMVESHPHKTLVHNTMSDLEESDTEEIEVGQEAGVHIPGSRPDRTSVAKSLPISMPAMMQQYRATEEDLDELPEDSHIDIPASIKALARSVHGETVFGDLPRPRKPKFTTQI